MPTYICSLGWTDQGIRTIKEAKRRCEAMRKRAEQMKIAIKNIYMTTGDRDLLVIMEAPDDETVAKFALVVGSSGNTRTWTCRAFTEAEFEEILDEVTALIPA
jgi:uncharacterized protein with GYD domain